MYIYEEENDGYDYNNNDDYEDNEKENDDGDDKVKAVVES